MDRPAHVRERWTLQVGGRGLEGEGRGQQVWGRALAWMAGLDPRLVVGGLRNTDMD